ncbi:MAG: ATP-binding protein [Deltaproteobacteria bacterium]|nr:ATP-binding protein [Deltaproteobacteria bacterium]
MVYPELRRRGIETGYFAESEREVDFVVGSVAEPLPIEVKLLDTLDPKDKRLSGLALFARRFPSARRALVITRSVQATVPYHGLELQAVPLWRFLLDAGRYLGETSWGIPGAQH